VKTSAYEMSKMAKKMKDEHNVKAWRKWRYLAGFNIIWRESGGEENGGRRKCNSLAAAWRNGVNNGNGCNEERSYQLSASLS